MSTQETTQRTALELSNLATQRDSSPLSALRTRQSLDKVRMSLEKIQSKFTKQGSFSRSSVDVTMRSPSPPLSQNPSIEGGKSQTCGGGIPGSDFGMRSLPGDGLLRFSGKRISQPRFLNGSSGVEPSSLSHLERSLEQSQRSSTATLTSTESQEKNSAHVTPPGKPFLNHELFSSHPLNLSRSLSCSKSGLSLGTSCNSFTIPDSTPEEPEKAETGSHSPNAAERALPIREEEDSQPESPSAGPKSKKLPILRSKFSMSPDSRSRRGGKSKSRETKASLGATSTLNDGSSSEVFNGKTSFPSFNLTWSAGSKGRRKEKRQPKQSLASLETCRMAGLNEKGGGKIDGIKSLCKMMTPSKFKARSDRSTEGLRRPSVRDVFSSSTDPPHTDAGTFPAGHCLDQERAHAKEYHAPRSSNLTVRPRIGNDVEPNKWRSMLRPRNQNAMEDSSKPAEKACSLDMVRLIGSKANLKPLTPGLVRPRASFDVLGSSHGRRYHPSKALPDFKLRTSASPPATPAICVTPPRESSLDLSEDDSQIFLHQGSEALQKQTSNVNFADASREPCLIGKEILGRPGLEKAGAVASFPCSMTLAPGTVHPEKEAEVSEKETKRGKLRKIQLLEKIQDGSYIPSRRTCELDRTTDGFFRESLDVGRHTYDVSRNSINVENRTHLEPVSGPSEKKLGWWSSLRLRSKKSTTNLKTKGLNPVKVSSSIGYAKYDGRKTEPLSSRTIPPAWRAGDAMIPLSDAAKVDHEVMVRRSEDLLRRTSTSVKPLPLKSSSMDMDRFDVGMSSRVIPIASGKVKRRSPIPALRLHEATPSRKAEEGERNQAANESQSDENKENEKPAINATRHPWLRQLKLQATVSFSPKRPSTPESQAGSASSCASTVPETFMRKEDTMRQPLVEILGSTPLSSVEDALPSPAVNTSLPIPPRAKRSRASTISSEEGKPLKPSRPNEATRSSVVTVGSSILFKDPFESTPPLPSPRRELISEKMKRMIANYGSSSTKAKMDSLEKTDGLATVPPQDPLPPLPVGPTQEDLVESLMDSPASLRDKKPCLNMKQGVQTSTFPGHYQAFGLEDELEKVQRLGAGSTDTCQRQVTGGQIDLSSASLRATDQATDVLHTLIDAFDEGQSVMTSPATSHVRRIQDAGSSEYLGSSMLNDFRASTTFGSIMTYESTEANSSFGDADDLQSILDDIMASSVGHHQSHLKSPSLSIRGSPCSKKAPERSRKFSGASYEAGGQHLNAILPGSGTRRPPPPPLSLSRGVVELSTLAKKKMHTPPPLGKGEGDGVSFSFEAVGPSSLPSTQPSTFKSNATEATTATTSTGRCTERLFSSCSDTSESGAELLNSTSDLTELSNVIEDSPCPPPRTYKSPTATESSGMGRTMYDSGGRSGSQRRLRAADLFLTKVRPHKGLEKPVSDDDAWLRGEKETPASKYAALCRWNFNEAKTKPEIVDQSSSASAPEMRGNAAADAAAESKMMEAQILRGDSLDSSPPCLTTNESCGHYFRQEATGNAVKGGPGIIGFRSEDLSPESKKSQEGPYLEKDTWRGDDAIELEEQAEVPSPLRAVIQRAKIIKKEGSRRASIVPCPPSRIDRSRMSSSPRRRTPRKRVISSTHRKALERALGNAKPPDTPPFSSPTILSGRTGASFMGSPSPHRLTVSTFPADQVSTGSKKVSHACDPRGMKQNETCEDPTFLPSREPHIFHGSGGRDDDVLVRKWNLGDLSMATLGSSPPPCNVVVPIVESIPHCVAVSPVHRRERSLSISSKESFESLNNPSILDRPTCTRWDHFFHNARRDIAESKETYPDTVFTDYLLSIFKPPLKPEELGMFLVDSRTLFRPLPEQERPVNLERLMERDFLDTPSRWKKSLSSQSQRLMGGGGRGRVTSEEGPRTAGLAKNHQGARSYPAQKFEEGTGNDSGVAFSCPDLDPESIHPGPTQTEPKTLVPAFLEFQKPPPPPPSRSRRGMLHSMKGPPPPPPLRRDTTKLRDLFRPPGEENRGGEDGVWKPPFAVSTPSRNKSRETESPNSSSSSSSSSSARNGKKVDLRRPVFKYVIQSPSTASESTTSRWERRHTRHPSLCSCSSSSSFSISSSSCR
ncbi:hypothetical protein IE53DRAFT_371667 [Violaceomyces palustris]|uniref:Uncharacterized protein n=1 Tax=Violaceomyces palustris TaxID=1673888 RepID=A0ACD0NMY0_9BASI|nr:hypothetical protein IE53DRAFT_371667 [Violaceomyces palustris]